MFENRHYDIQCEVLTDPPTPHLPLSCILLPKRKWLDLLAARIFLEKIDSGATTDAWDNSGPTFKKNVPRIPWVAGTKSMREEFGKVVSRDVKGVHATDSIEGLPEGKYVMVYIRSKYEHQPSNITAFLGQKSVLERDIDGQWRVAMFGAR